MTPQQHQLLLAIKGRPERTLPTITDLARALLIRHHAAVGLVDRCECGGWVRRRAAPSDRRQVGVSLTRKGERALGRLTERNREELRRLRRALRLPFLEE